MSTVVEMQGWITDANLTHPEKRYGYPDRYRLDISPFNSYDIYEIERRVDEMKERAAYAYQNPDYEMNSSGHKDEITDGSSIVFQTLREVKLHPELRDLEDHQLVGKFVKVVGHIQQYPDGNCWLSYHIVEPSYRDIPEIEQSDSDVEEDWDF